MLTPSAKSYPTPLKHQHLKLVAQVTTEGCLGQLAMETGFKVHAMPFPVSTARQCRRFVAPTSGAREYGKVKLATIIPTQHKHHHQSRPLQVTFSYTDCKDRQAYLALQNLQCVTAVSITPLLQQGNSLKLGLKCARTAWQVNCFRKMTSQASREMGRHSHSYIVKQCNQENICAQLLNKVHSNCNE